MNYEEKQKLAEKNKDIPTKVIEQDIADTQAEIAQMEEEAKYLSATPLSMPTERWDHIRADARETGIKERKVFIEQLEAILEVRRLSQKEDRKG